MVDNTVVIKHANGFITIRDEKGHDVDVYQYADGDIVIRDEQDDEAVYLPFKSAQALMTVLDLLTTEAGEEDEVFESEDEDELEVEFEPEWPVEAEFSPEEWEDMLDDDVRDEDAEAAFLRGFMDALNGMFVGFPEGEIDEYHV